MERRSPIWLIIVLLVALTALSWEAGRTVAPLLSDDSYQYLGAARHLLEHGSLATWVAHFEEQVDSHRFPVPLTHFAAGYPLAVAAVLCWRNLRRGPASNSSEPKSGSPSPCPSFIEVGRQYGLCRYFARRSLLGPAVRKGYDGRLRSKSKGLASLTRNSL